MGIQNATWQELNDPWNEWGTAELDFEQDGFEWLDFSDWEKSIISFLRKGKDPRNLILVVCNFTPVVRSNYRLGIPKSGIWKEVLNSDAKEYGGSGNGNLGGLEASPVPFHGKYHSLSLVLPPLGILVFKRQE